MSSDNSDLILNKREVETTLTVDDGAIGVIGGLLVFFLFPRKEREQELLAVYRTQDAEPASDPPAVPPETAPATR